MYSSIMPRLRLRYPPASEKEEYRYGSTNVLLKKGKNKTRGNSTTTCYFCKAA